MIAQLFHAGGAPWAQLGPGLYIRVDIRIHNSQQPVDLPTEILLPVELVQFNHDQPTFWLTGFNVEIPPAILAWLRHHPHYSSLVREDLPHA